MTDHTKILVSVPPSIRTYVEETGPRFSVSLKPALREDGALGWRAIVKVSKGTQRLRKTILDVLELAKPFPAIIEAIERHSRGA